MTTNHIDALLDDYVLDLLAAEERRQLTQHTARCPRCMGLLLSERRRTQIAGALRGATVAPPGRLGALWPSVAAAVFGRAHTNWQAQWRAAFAAFAAALLFLAGAAGGLGRLDGLLLGTHTPTVASTASPTVSTTPTPSRPSGYPGYSTVDIVAFQPTAWGTAEPALADPAPQPRPNPAAAFAPTYSFPNAPDASALD